MCVRDDQSQRLGVLETDMYNQTQV